jgi:orotate phosphoribosyltransferase
MISDLDLAVRLVQLSTPDKPFADQQGRAVRFLLDTRGVVDDPELRDAIVDRLISRITPLFATNEANLIAGISKSGVPWAAIAADRLRVPLAVVLEEARASGLRRQVEGNVNGLRAVLVENFARTGKSLRNAVAAISAAGGTVAKAIALVATPRARRSEGTLSVFNFDEMLELLVVAGRLDADECRAILSDEEGV